VTAVMVGEDGAGGGGGGRGRAREMKTWILDVTVYFLFARETARALAKLAAHLRGKRDRRRGKEEGKPTVGAELIVELSPRA